MRTISILKPYTCNSQRAKVETKLNVISAFFNRIGSRMDREKGGHHLMIPIRMKQTVVVAVLR
jgi:hypothetical protein